VRRFDLIRDQRGTTLVELLVATTAGIVVLAGLSATVIVTVRESSRVTSHVHANQQARLAMTRVVDQLRSACFSYEMAPVMKESNGTSLIFAQPTPTTATKVAPTAMKTVISLSGTNLLQSNYAATTTAAPWSYSTTPSSTTTLMADVSPVSTGAPIFRYYAYSNGEASKALGVPLTEATAAEAVQVNVAFKVAPQTPLSAASDPNVGTPLQNSVLLRFTPSGFETSAEYRPCE
jgi:Tfp pilus assembly protein PilW